MSTLHDTADAVKAQINAATGLSVEFTATLQYDTDLLLEDLDTLDVGVVPASLTMEKDSRISFAYNAGIDIAVRYRFGTADQNDDGTIKLTSIETYSQLLEEIAEELGKPANLALTDKATATWLRNEIRFPWVPEHLRQNRQFTGIFRATYYVAKDAS